MTCFEDITRNEVLIDLDWIAFVSFSLEIIFNCCTQYEEIDGTLVRSHKSIIWRYFKNGGLILDLISTAPLYLFENKNLTLFKLLRLIRLPRLRKVFGLKESGFLFESYTNRGNAVERV